MSRLNTHGEIVEVAQSLRVVSQAQRKSESQTTKPKNLMSLISRSYLLRDPTQLLRD